MSIRARSILGAAAFFGGLLLVVGGGVRKSSVRIQFERAVEQGLADPAHPPSKSGPNLLMALGALGSIGGLVGIGLAARDMVAQIGSASASAERRLQNELMITRDSKPKPKP